MAKSPENASAWQSLAKATLTYGKAAVLAAVMGCMGNGNQEKKHDAEGHDHQSKTVEVALPPNVIAKLAENEDALLQIQKVGVQAYFDKLQQQQAIIVAENPDVIEICVCCIDERQVKNKSHGVAGIGVRASDEQLKFMVRNTLAIAEKRGAKDRQITIRLQPHEGCGAAALALKESGVKNATPEQINAKANEGANRTKNMFLSEASDRGLKINVVVETYVDTFPIKDHPAAIAVVNHVDDTVSRKDDPDHKAEGHVSVPFIFHASALVNGKKAAEEDAVLAAAIAHLSHHGYLDIAKKLPKDFPFIIVNAVSDGHEGRQRKLEVEKMLREHKQLATYFEKGYIVVDTWVVPAPHQESRLRDNDVDVPRTVPLTKVVADERTYDRKTGSKGGSRLWSPFRRRGDEQVTRQDRKNVSAEA